MVRPLYTILHAEHALSTPLSDVGQQVWRGALLMADYVVHNREQFKGSTVLEVGAGVGVVSILASLFGAECVFCTGLHIEYILYSAFNFAELKIRG